MNVISKAVASITPGPDDASSEHGTFDVILSAQSKDRDGETLRSDEWKTPLPDHITFDIDHGMTVGSTVGSGKPFINDDGNLQVKGGYSSIPRAQEVRTLINEGHIRTTSVTFMTTKTAKSNDGKAERELLNGSFVPIPSNRDTVVLASKALDVFEKAGARNNSDDRKSIQAIHDHAASLGASCSTEDAQRADTGEMDGANKSVSTVYVDVVPRIRAAVVESDGKSEAERAMYVGAEALAILKAAAAGAKTAGATETKTSVAYVAKALSNSVEDLQARLRDALTDVYGEKDDPDTWVWLEATFLDAGGKSGSVVYSLNGDSLSRTFTDDGNQVTLGDEVTDVTIVTTVVPEGDGKDDDGSGDMKSLARKAVSDADWDGSASRFTIEQWRASCLIGPSEDSTSKNDYKLPVKEPSGDVNSNAVHAAAAALAGGRGGVDAPTAAKEKAAKTLVGLYRNQLKEDPPDSILELAGESPKDDAKSADPAAADVKSAAAVSADEDNAKRALAMRIQLQAQALL